VEPGVTRKIGEAGEVGVEYDRSWRTKRRHPRTRGVDEIKKCMHGWVYLLRNMKITGLKDGSRPHATRELCIHPQDQGGYPTPKQWLSGRNVGVRGNRSWPNGGLGYSYRQRPVVRVMFAGIAPPRLTSRINNQITIRIVLGGIEAMITNRWEQSVSGLQCRPVCTIIVNSRHYAQSRKFS